MKVNLGVIKRIFYKKKLTVNNVKKTTKKYLADILSLKEYLQSIVCPNCNKSKVLVVMNYEMGNEAWEAIVGCSGCGSKGIINPTGLSFKLNVNKILKDEE